MKDILNYKGFIGSVHFSTDDKVFFGKVEGVNDLITFEGQSVDELVNAFQFVVDEHIKDCANENIDMENFQSARDMYAGITPWDLDIQYACLS